MSNLGSIQTPLAWSPVAPPALQRVSTEGTTTEPCDTLVRTAAAGQGSAYEQELESLSKLRRCVIMGGLLLAGLGGGPTSSATPVPLELAAGDTPSLVIAPDATTLVKSFGLSDKGAARLQQDNSLQTQARLVPDSAATMFRSYSSNQKRYLYETFTGETRVGLMSINNRDAFVKGRALGQDVFPYMSQNLHKAVLTGELSQSEMQQLDANLDAMKQLSPAQREAIANLVVADQAP